MVCPESVGLLAKKQGVLSPLPCILFKTVQVRICTLHELHFPRLCRLDLSVLMLKRLPIPPPHSFIADYTPSCTFGTLESPSRKSYTLCMVTACVCQVCKEVCQLFYPSPFSRVSQKSVKRYTTDQESAKITNKKSYHIPITVHTFHEVLVSDRPSAHASGRKNGFSPQALQGKRCDGADCFCQRIALPDTSSQTDALR